MSRDNVYLGPTMVECQPGRDSVLCTVGDGSLEFVRACLGDSELEVLPIGIHIDACFSKEYPNKFQRYI